MPIGLATEKGLEIRELRAWYGGMEMASARFRVQRLETTRAWYRDGEEKRREW